MKIYQKDPSAKLLFGEDWTEWLEGATISSATVTAPTGITVAYYTNSTTHISAMITGGTSGSDYEILFKINSSTGEEDLRRIKIQVRPT